MPGPAARSRRPPSSSAAAPPRAPPWSRHRSSRSARPGPGRRRPAAPARPAGWSRSAPTSPGAAAASVPERALRAGRPATGGCEADPVMCLPVRQRAEQPVERPPATAPAPSSARARPRGSAFGPPDHVVPVVRGTQSVVSPIACRIASTTRRRPGRRRRPPGRPPVGHPGQAAGLLPLAAVLDRAGGHRLPRRGQLGRLRPLPPGQRPSPGRTPAGGPLPAARPAAGPAAPRRCAAPTAQRLGDRGLGSPSTGPRSGSDRGRLTGRPPRPGPRSTAQAARCPGRRHLPPPEQVKQHREDRQEVPGLSRPRQQRSRCGERPPQRARRSRAARAAGMPVTRQPPDVRRQDRVDRPHPAELPASRLAGPGSDLERLRVRLPIRSSARTSITTPVPPAQPGEEIRGMARARMAVAPVQPERLRRHGRHRRVEVQQHQVIPLQPRLVTDMPPGRGQPPPAREMPLPPRPPERAGRPGILEQHPAAGRQASTAPAAADGELQLNAVAPGPSERTSGLPCQSHPSAR